jgi:toxin-antitoxin system PIN domain toxin
MMRLADVNVLIAFADTNHSFHAAARSWLAANPKTGLATCALTGNGFLRIYGHPSYPHGPGSPERAMVDLRGYRNRRGHRFLPCDLSFDDPIFASLGGVTPKQLTDLYLVALAGKHDSRFLTFDTTIPVDLLKDGRKSLETIGP